MILPSAGRVWKVQREVVKPFELSQYAWIPNNAWLPNGPVNRTLNLDAFKLVLEKRMIKYKIEENQDSTTIIV